MASSVSNGNIQFPAIALSPRSNEKNNSWASLRLKEESSGKIIVDGGVKKVAGNTILNGEKKVEHIYVDEKIIGSFDGLEEAKEMFKKIQSYVGTCNYSWRWDAEASSVYITLERDE